MSSQFYSEKKYTNRIIYGVKDQYYNFVSLLLHMDGSSGSTTFMDNSPSPRTVTAVGNAQISTAQSKFGGSSGLFDGAGDRLTATLSSGIAGDFAIEVSVYINSLAAIAPILTLGDGFGASGLLFYVTTGGKVSVFGNNSVLVTGTTQTVTTGSFFDLAITRISGTLRMYVNSVNDGSTAYSANVSPILTIGAEVYNSAIGSQFNGYIDELRITNGVGRTISTQTLPFPNG